MSHKVLAQDSVLGPFQVPAFVNSAALHMSVIDVGVTAESGGRHMFSVRGIAGAFPKQLDPLTHSRSREGLSSHRVLKPGSSLICSHAGVHVAVFHRGFCVRFPDAQSYSVHQDVPKV